MGLYATRDGTLYVVDRYNDRVVKYASTSGQNGTQIGDGRGNGPRQLVAPTAVVVDEATNAVYICDHENSRIQLWSEGGLGPNVETVLGTSTSNDTDTSAFPQADDIQLDPGSNDTLHILDIRNARLSKWKFWAKNSESSYAVYRGAMGIHVDAQRNLYVADCYRHEITKWANGRHVGGTGESASPLNQLKCPSAVVVDSRGNMFIVDSRNHRIMRWEVNATQGACIVGCSTTRGNSTDQLSFPKDVTFDWKGNLLVADTGNNRVQRFDLFINATCGEY